MATRITTPESAALESIIYANLITCFGAHSTAGTLRSLAFVADNDPAPVCYPGHAAILVEPPLLWVTTYRSVGVLSKMSDSSWKRFPPVAAPAHLPSRDLIAVPRPRAAFVYTTEGGTGLSAKAGRIAQGLEESGYTVDAIYFLAGSAKLQRLLNWVRTVVRATRTVLRGDVQLALIRYAYYFLPLYLLPRRFQRNVRVEINGDSQAELAANSQWLRRRIDLMALRAVMTHGARVHVVSRELAARYKATYPDARITFTPNFVCDEYYDTDRTSPTAASTLNVVFLGSTTQQWHGVDLFIETVVRHSWFRENCRLHIVGEISPAIEQLVQRLAIDSVVIRHGFQAGTAKHALMSSMHIGIGGFALHLKGITETTAIKTAEYLHAGLAVVVGYRDSAVDEDLPYVLQMDLAHDPEPAETFKVFAERVRNHPEFPRQAHLYAREHLLVAQYVQSLARS